LGRLIRLHDRYKGRATFLLIAITDAGHEHAEGTPLAGEQTLRKADPEARWQLLRKGLAAYKVPFPGLLDEDGSVERAYGAYPKRLLIVGADGLVVFDGARGVTAGPSEWDLEEAERHLRSALRPASNE
jgi:hypothetical protein